MIGDYKIVEFDKYCKDCVNKDTPQDESPCDECLLECGRIDSHKPVNFKKKEEKKK